MKFIVGIAIFMVFIQCKSAKSLPATTSASGSTAFSLSGNWQLFSSSDNKALEGTVIRVIPGVTDATIKTLGNNTYCVREMDVVWKGVKSNGGAFAFDNLVNACSGSPEYRAATLTVVNNDEVRVQGKTTAGVELVQVWKRMTS